MANLHFQSEPRSNAPDLVAGGPSHGHTMNIKVTKPFLAGPANPQRLGCLRRVASVVGLLKDLRWHDLRASRTFIRRMLSGQSGPSRWIGFIRWLCFQSFVSIPDGLREVQWGQPVSKTPIWLAEGNPLANHPWSWNPGAELPEKAEVVVIGAGFTGGSLAYHWAKAGVQTLMVVLDMDDPATGASGRNGGEVVMGRYFAMVYKSVLNYLPRLRSDLSGEDLAKLAQQFASVYCKAAYKNADLIERTIREEGFECAYARKGWVQERTAREQGALEESVRTGLENGFTDWGKLSAEEASQKTGATIELAANFSNGAGCFHPSKWVWCLFQSALKSQSVQLFTHTKVLSVKETGAVYRIRTERGTIEANYVVNATEAYTARLHKDFQSIIQPRQSQAAFGVERGRSLKPNVTFSSSTMFCGRHGDGLLFGSDETPIPNSKAGQNRPSRFITKYLIGQLRRSFGLFPLRITNEWSGSVGFTPDEYPVVGVMDGKRQYVIGGMSGSGTAVSFNAGRCVCRRILGYDEPDDYPTEYFGPTRLLDPLNHAWPKLDQVLEAPI